MVVKSIFPYIAELVCNKSNNVSIHICHLGFFHILKKRLDLIGILSQWKKNKTKQDICAGRTGILWYLGTELRNINSVQIGL